MDYKIDYISILAQAQKLINSQTLQGYLGIAERVAAVDPNSIVKTDWDKFLEEAGNTVSLPAKVIRSEEEAQDIREFEAQKQAEMEQLAMGSEQANQLKTLSETQTAGGSNALADIQES